MCPLPEKQTKKWIEPPKSAAPSVHLTLKIHQIMQQKREQWRKFMIVEATFKFATQHSRISTVYQSKTKFWVNNPTTHHYYSPYRPYRMKHDPFPILIHLGEREDYSGVSRGREIVLCCCVPSSRELATYLYIELQLRE